MADEVEKKPEFVLNKRKNEDKSPVKKPDTGSGTSEKRRIVVVKKRTSGTGNEKQHEAVHPVVKHTNEKSAVPDVEEDPKVIRTEQPTPKPAAKEQRPWRTNSFELNTTRPNIKAGNLSGHPQQRGTRGGYSGQRGSGYNRDNSASGRQESGFTGAQAREGYQNRERENRNGGGSYSGYRGNNPRGGYNNNVGGGYQGRTAGTGPQSGGGYRPGPNTGTRTGGYRGTFGGRPGYNNGSRPGYNNGPRPGYNNGSRPGYNNGPRPGYNNGPRSEFNNQVPVVAGKTPAKKSFKGKKQVYNRKNKEESFDEDRFFGQKKKSSTPANVVPKQIDIMETISVSDLAKKMNLKASEIIGKLMSMGMMVTITQSIDADTATLLASEYGCGVHLVSLYDETVIESDKGVAETVKTRPPIVTVMGHVDHGKTKTLDAIRHTNVVAGESGGITQKIGAYSVTTPKGKITFLDTPGHEAFTMMRARGAQITDIVVLVVAADDGVMPQTLEAIHHARDAKVPIIVAVNKIDKPDANPDRVRTQLSEQGLTPEDWGGDTQYVNISALKGLGIDDLLDAILLQSEMLELKTQWNCRAEGKVIESRVDQGRGVVSTVIVQRGTLHTGDPFVAGIYSGRVRAMFDDRGNKLTESTPSTPVEVLGMDDMPNAGDPFQVTENEKDARAISSKRQELKRFEDAKAVKKVTLDNLYQTIDASEVKEFKVVIKADLQGSAEALKQALEKLSTKDIRLVVIHSSAGAINESDVMLAAADSNAIIIGFNVRPTPKAKLLADQEKVEIRKYTIIYKAVEEVTLAMEGMLKPDTKEEVTGTLEVRNTFKVPKIGLIAGCYVTDGLIKRTSSVNLIRDGIVKCTCKVSSLKRFKDDAKEVKTGFECGVGLENWQDIQVGDQLEAFEYVEIARKLGDALVDEKAVAEKKAAERAAEQKAKQTAEEEAEQREVAAEKAAAKARKLQKTKPLGDKKE